MQHPHNPYTAGAPLRGEQGFFGRQDVIEWVTRELRNSTSNSLVLYGQRRIGKTSLLLRLQRTLPDDVFLPVYFNLQDQAERPLERILGSLVNKVATRSGSDIEWQLPDDEGDSLVSMFLTQLDQILKKGCRPVFLLDEFDVLDQVAQMGLPDTAAAKTLFPFLRRVMDEDLFPAFVFAIGRRAEDLSLDYVATFKTSLSKEIWVLDRESAEELVLQAQRNGTLRFTDQAVECILRLTSCHPYLTQLLCQRVWERVYARNPTSVPWIDNPEIEAAVPDALETGKQGLSWLWRGLTSPEKIYAAALVEAAGDEKVISESRVTYVLAKYAARLRTREVELAPRDLVRRKVLEVTGDGEYRFAVELFRRWVRRYKPLRDVQDELDRIEEPVADGLCAAGEALFIRRQWETAIPYFRDALGKYPQHLRSRLCLGESLLRLGQTNKAVAELEQAYALDEKQARNALVQALVTHAKARDNESDEEGALEACKRALEVSPQNPEAQQIHATVWRRRGDAAWERHDLETALDAYQMAGYAEMVAEAKEALHVRQLYEQGMTCLNQEKWVEATVAFREVLQRTPSYKHAAAQLEKAEHMARLARTLRKAQILLGDGDFDACLQELVGLWRKDSTYERDEVIRLRKIACDQLYNQAGRQLERRQFRESLATLDTLRKFSPTYPGLGKLEAQARAGSRVQDLQAKVGLDYADSQDIGVRAIASSRMRQMGKWILCAGAVIVTLGLLIFVFVSGNWPFLYPDSLSTPTETVGKPSVTPTQALTPTPSPTSAPTPSPTSTPSVTSTLDDVAIAVQGTGIFAVPDADSQVLGTVGEGEQVVVLARSAYEDWIYIRNDQSVEGFVYSPHLEWSGNYESLPFKESTVTTPVATSETPVVLLERRSVDEMTMVFVSAGQFLMGSNLDKDPDAQEDEDHPQGDVFLSAFWIDQTEVSVAQFERFVMETGYETEAEREGWGYAWDETEWKRVDGADWQHPHGPGSSARSTHPVVLVSWNDAAAYCTWVGGALPTEAQWEKAARGDEGWIYPWGDRFDGNKVNFCDASCLLGWRSEDFDDGYQSLAPVGSFQNGASPYGALNMSGNVWEWVADWYGDYSSTQVNPTGPENGDYKVLRGGAWYGPQAFTRAANRLESSPDSRYSYVGFRCVVPQGE